MPLPGRFRNSKKSPSAGAGRVDPGDDQGSLESARHQRLALRPVRVFVGTGLRHDEPRRMDSAIDRGVVFPRAGRRHLLAAGLVLLPGKEPRLVLTERDFAAHAGAKVRTQTVEVAVVG